MPESTSLKRNTDDEVLPQGYSTELSDWKEVIVDEDGKQYVRDTEVLAKLTEMDNKLQTLEGTVDSEGNQKVSLNGNKFELISDFEELDVFATDDFQFVGSSSGTSSSNAILDVSNYAKRAVYVRNNYSEQIEMDIRLASTEKERSVQQSEKIIIAAGDSVFLDEIDSTSLNSTITGIFITLYGTEGATGSVDVEFYGGVS